MKKLTVQLVAVAAGLVFAACAFAGSSLSTGYEGKSGVEATVAKTTSPAQTQGSTAGTLPFTGLDLTLIVVGGVVLLLAGAGLRRVARDKS